MDDIVTAIGAIALLAIIALIAPLIGVLAGAFSGWVVGFYFTAQILDFLHRFGVNVDGLAVWQIGAALGFLGSFFRPNVSTSSSK